MMPIAPSNPHRWILPAPASIDVRCCFGWRLLFVFLLSLTCHGRISARTLYKVSRRLFFSLLQSRKDYSITQQATRTLFQWIFGQNNRPVYGFLSSFKVGVTIILSSFSLFLLLLHVFFFVFFSRPTTFVAEERGGNDRHGAATYPPR